MRVSNGEEIHEVKPKNLKAAEADGFVPLVRVTDGKETHEVHPSNLEAAEHDGFKVISGGYENVKMDESPLAVAKDYGAAMLPFAPPDQKFQSGQRIERDLQKLGLIQPGDEMLAPGNWEAAKRAAPYVAGGTLAGMAGVGLLTSPLAAVSTRFPEMVTAAGSPVSRSGLLKTKLGKAGAGLLGLGGVGKYLNYF